MWSLTHYLLRHRWQALILTFLITYIPVLGMASILVAALFTLCAGVLEGALFTLVATLPYLLIFLVSNTQEAEVFTMMTFAAAILTVTSNTLTYVFTVLLRRHWSWSAILQIAALVGVLVISVIHLAYPDVGEWWGRQLTLFYNQATDLSGAKPVSGELLEGNQLDTINTVKSFATGMVVSFVLFTAVVQVMLARWWQVAIVNRGRMGKELFYIRLSRLAGVLFFASIIFCYLENRVALDILPVLCLLFGAAGLSLIHYLCGLMDASRGRFWLTMLYLALMYSLAMIAMLTVLNVMLPVMLAVLILTISLFAFVTLGFFDVWFDLRRRSRKV
jgi:hypothetical protein